MPDSPNPTPPKPTPGAKPAARYDYGVDPVMADLLKTSAQATKQLCTKCNAFMKPDAVICTSCGWNKNTGKAMSTRVVVEKKPKDEPSAKRGIQLLDWLSGVPPMVTFLVCALGLVPLGMGIMGKDTTMLAIGILVYLAVAVLFWVVMLIEGFRESTGIGFILLICSLLPVANWYTLYWVYTENENGHLKAGYTIAVIGNLMIMAAKMTGGLGSF